MNALNIHHNNGGRIGWNPTEKIVELCVGDRCASGQEHAEEQRQGRQAPAETRIEI